MGISRSLGGCTFSCGRSAVWLMLNVLTGWPAGRRPAEHPVSQAPMPFTSPWPLSS
jgi:hypothetical protein